MATNLPPPPHSFDMTNVRMTNGEIFLDTIHKTWVSRVRRAARDAHVDVGIGEPGDGLKIRIEALELLASRLKAMERTITDMQLELQAVKQQHRQQHGHTV